MLNELVDKKNFFNCYIVLLVNDSLFRVCK